MKRIGQILKWALISTIGLVAVVVLSFLIYINLIYEREMNVLKKQLNEIENVTVVNIWGHKDVTLEEISARLLIKDKGELVLYGLSKDAFNYPDRIPITEIGGYSFKIFNCNGRLSVGSNIDIGKNTTLGRKIDIECRSVIDVIDNYEKIITVIENLEHSPELNHFISPSNEQFLLIKSKKSDDRDPIFVLSGVENSFEFAKTLNWNNSDCLK